jgi:coenzyme F420-reducing hydrogenase alpha subunit
VSNLQVNLHHVTRVEGHGNIVIDVKGGKLDTCRFDVVETPRFFEAMLRGRPYQDASHITSRICGICAVGHATTSLRATENALGIVPSEQTVLLRKLNFFGEILDSHVLHVMMLVAPDLLGVGSVIPLARSAPTVVGRALRMKKLAGDLCRAICGRHTHPLSLTVGGFARFPTLDELSDLRTRLEAMRADIDDTVELLSGLTFPEFQRDTEYLALYRPDEYAFIDGDLRSSDGGTWPASEYRQLTNEHVVAHSSAKHTRHNRDSYMVGALARFNLNHEQLCAPAVAAAQALGLKAKCTNPYFNTVAQLVEIVHAAHEAIGIINALLTRGIQIEEPVRPNQLSGEGVGVCEVPRGTLFHRYIIDQGIVVAADCVIPTGQNLANIEADMRALVPEILDEPREDIVLKLEMLVRAYDPCISCSTHLVDVKFLE